MSLNGYLVCILTTTLFSSILTTIIPEGKTSILIKGVAKLVCLVAILSPIPKFLQKQAFFDYLQDDNQSKINGEVSQNVILTNEDFINYFSGMRITLLEQEIAGALQTKFKVPCRIQLTCEYDMQYAEVFVRSIMIYGVEDDAIKTAMLRYLAENGYNEVHFE